MLLCENAISDTSAPSERPSAPAAFATAEVRTLTAGDLPDIQRMLAGLDQPSRCLRFGWASNDASLDAHARSAVATANRILGVVVDRQLRGIVEIYRAPSGSAKVVIVVDQRWRRRGLGWTLLKATMDWADATDIDTLRLTFSRHNWPMRRLTAKACARLDIGLDEMSAEIATRRMRRRPQSTHSMPTERLR
jgi:GNAT superfamily N-acetyltransferase